MNPASKDDIVVLGELHVPVNRPVIIELSSKDVIHNFLLAAYAHRGGRDRRLAHPDVVQTDQAALMKSFASALRPRSYGMKGMVVVDEPAEYNLV